MITQDPKSLTSILINLISNAIKFTFKGGIVVKASMSTQNMLKIKVKDTGHGIKPEDINKLFKMFGSLEETKAINK